MTPKTVVTRATFAIGLLGAGTLVLAPDALAARNTAAEEYVTEHLSTALRSLNQGRLSAVERRRAFNQLISDYSDWPRIATFVVGRHGNQLRNQPALHSEWMQTFRDYAIAMYEDRLERFAGSSIRVTGSEERSPGIDVVVDCEVTARHGNRPYLTQWRLLRSGELWKVVDVSLLLEGSRIWLAQQQRTDIVAFLDRNEGDARALILAFRALTIRLRERIGQRA